MTGRRSHGRLSALNGVVHQGTRNVTDPVYGCLRRARYLIHDRDPLDTRGFGEILKRFS